MTDFVNKDERYDIVYGATERCETIKSVAVIDSQYRDDPSLYSPSDYYVTLINKYPDATSIELVYADIPNSNYNIDSNNNKLLILDAGGANLKNITIPVGLYTPTNLAAKLGTELGAGWTVGLTPITEKIFIQNAASFTLDIASNFRFKENTIAKILGFKPENVTSQLVGVTTQRVESNYPVELEMDHYISMFIEGMERCDSNQGYIQDAFCVVPLDPKNENFGLFKDGNLVDNDTFTYYFNPPRKLARLHITFRDWRGNLYDFNGLNHTLVFKIETATHKKMFSVTK